MIKASLKKKECPYCRDKLLKNECKDIDSEDIDVEDEEDDEVAENIIGEMEFSENGESDSDYEPEINLDRNIISFRNTIFTNSYLKKQIQIKSHKYLFCGEFDHDYINRFKDCDFELFKEIPINLSSLSFEFTNEHKKIIYDSLFSNSNDIYSLAKAYKKFKKIKNKKVLEKKFLNKAIERIESIAIKVKKNKSKKNIKEKISNNRSFKF
jgi:hypothetical protein